MEVRTRPYEILVRFHLDGVAAHVCEIEEVVDKGVVVSARELPPRSLLLAGPEFGALAAAVNTNILAERDRLAEEVINLKKQLAASQR